MAKPITHNAPDSQLKAALDKIGEAITQKKGKIQPGWDHGGQKRKLSLSLEGIALETGEQEALTAALSQYNAKIEDGVLTLIPSHDLGSNQKVGKFVETIERDLKAALKNPASINIPVPTASIEAGQALVDNAGSAIPENGSQIVSQPEVTEIPPVEMPAPAPEVITIGSDGTSQVSVVYADGHGLPSDNQVFVSHTDTPGFTPGDNTHIVSSTGEMTAGDTFTITHTDQLPHSEPISIDTHTGLSGHNEPALPAGEANLAGSGVVVAENGGMVTIHADPHGMPGFEQNITIASETPVLSGYSPTVIQSEVAGDLGHSITVTADAGNRITEEAVSVVAPATNVSITSSAVRSAETTLEKDGAQLAKAVEQGVLHDIGKFIAHRPLTAGAIAAGGALVAGALVGKPLLRSMGVLSDTPHQPPASFVERCKTDNCEQWPPKPQKTEGFKADADVHAGAVHLKDREFAASVSHSRER